MEGKDTAGRGKGRGGRGKGKERSREERGGDGVSLPEPGTLKPPMPMGK